MRISAISVTEQGRRLSLRLSEGLGSAHTVKRYCFYRHCDSEAEAFKSIGDTAALAFSSSDAVVFICACGIAVRASAPHVVSKLRDPAVIVIDDMGRWAIPLLSGHIGGANALALEISKLIGAKPCITTATDIRGRFSPDLFAMANSLIITDMEEAKYAAAASANGEQIYFYSEYETENLPAGLTGLSGADELGEIPDGAAAIYIGSGKALPEREHICAMVPRNIVLGIGCRKNCTSEQIENTVRDALQRNHIMPQRVIAAGSIDIKKDEPGLLEFCSKMKLELRTFSAAELNAAPDKYHTEEAFHASGFVKSVTGTDNVCERSAFALSGGGRIVMYKTKGDGVTAAAAEKKVLIRFET